MDFDKAQTRRQKAAAFRLKKSRARRVYEALSQSSAQSGRGMTYQITVRVTSVSGIVKEITAVTVPKPLPQDNA